jgi:hypothetical protein
MPAGNTPAGTGEHHTYLISGGGADQGPLRAEEHYLGIDAVSWYVNKDSGWFTKRMASGALTVKLAGGSETYEVGLGLYDLASGAHLAPVFEKPVLPDRVFRGGVITLTAVLTGLAQDTKVARLMKTTASAALGVVGGLVQTASLGGLSAPLKEAGTTLLDGVRSVLDGQDKKMQLFDPAGLEVSVRPGQLLGPETYVLLHRGTALDPARLQVAPKGQSFGPVYDGAELTDGAWLLLRFRRAFQYPVVRGWAHDFRKWQADVAGLVDDVRNDAGTKDDALRALQPGSETRPTVSDQYRKLRDQILNDGVLTQTEATAYAGILSNYRRLALRAIQTGDYAGFFDGIKKLRTEARSGGVVGPESQAEYAQALDAAAEVRVGAAPTEQTGLESEGGEEAVPGKEPVRVEPLGGPPEGPAGPEEMAAPVGAEEVLTALKHLPRLQELLAGRPSGRRRGRRRPEAPPTPAGAPGRPGRGRQSLRLKTTGLSRPDRRDK